MASERKNVTASNLLPSILRGDASTLNLNRDGQTISDIQDDLLQAADRIVDLERDLAECKRQIARAESLLDVPDTRSRYLSGKLDVVLTRMQKEINFRQATISRLERDLAAAKMMLAKYMAIEGNLQEQSK